ncbi:MAG: nucleoside hydrolase [Spirochaetaceae bacterium]|nr:nucleoside hydrolase [Spirochaetaceae bacterium]
MTRMIIDCDPGLDDAIALILAHHCAEVVGITTVSGNVPLAATTANALMLTAMLDVPTPVHSGAAGPLVGEPTYAPHVHGESGMGDFEPPAHDRTVAGDDAVSYLLDAAAPDVWVAAVGPLTNLALAIERDPEWVKRIAGISIMGGSTAGGNVTAAAEFNIYADPEAAVRVFGSGADIVMCGLNLTHQVMTSDALVADLRAGGAPLERFAAGVFDFLHGVMADLLGERATALHDPCAVLSVTHPELFELTPRAVGVEVAGALTRGMTVVDERPSHLGPPANARVAYRIDAQRAMALVRESLRA